MKITRVRITNYRGIEELDAAIAPAGAIVKGSNGQAKTSVLKAIQAALAARDIGPEAIRVGAERAEILVDIDNLQVRRVISPKGPTISVAKDIGDGIKAKVPSPKDFLRDLLGTSPIDPIELVTEKDKKKRRAQILAALPVRVTAEQVRKWLEEECQVDTSGHGLEVISQLRATYYDRRTAANARAKEAAAKAVDARAKLAATSPPDEPIDVDAAESEVTAARARLATVDAQMQAAQAAEQRTATTRARVADLRAKAEAEVAGITEPPAEEVAKAERILQDWRDRVAEVEAELAEARQRLGAAEMRATQLRARAEQASSARRRASGMIEQATDLESAIQTASAPAPSREEREATAATRRAAEEKLESARTDAARLAAYTAALRTKLDAEKAADQTAAEADRLDRIVSRLTHDAPAELLAGSDGIPGLAVSGDDIFLDGVILDGLCGREQLQFAVEIARRANANSRILLVDGLERIAPEHIDEFVQLATADGWQLLATRVTDGERVINAIEL